MRMLQELTNQLRLAQQEARNAYGQYNPGSGPTSGGAYITTPGSAIASGASLSCTVFQIKGGSSTSLGSATVWNMYNSSVVSGKICTLAPDSTGAFVVLAQSCT